MSDMPPERKETGYKLKIAWLSCGMIRMSAQPGRTCGLPCRASRALASALAVAASRGDAIGTGLRCRLGVASLLLRGQDNDAC